MTWVSCQYSRACCGFFFAVDPFLCLQRISQEVVPKRDGRPVPATGNLQSHDKVDLWDIRGFSFTPVLNYTMNRRLSTIKNKEKLNNFLEKQKQSQFLQSWEWGEFQEAVGNTVFRVGVEENEELIAVATLIKKYLPGQKSKAYFFCPRGPIFQNLEFLFDEIKRLAKKENVIFLRFEPQEKIQNIKHKVQDTINIQPKKTLILDISKTEEDLLKEMHKKTRYNIRLASKKEVEISELKEDEFDELWELIKETSERDGFRSHPRRYYEKMFKLSNDFLKFYIAKYEGKIISCLIATFFGDMATYTHGASSNEHRNVMAPYLLQWHTIKEAQKRGIKYYDFHGIDEKKWPGVTKFKKGFGGEIINYPGTFDMVFNSFWYHMYKIARWIRRKLG